MSSRGFFVGQIIDDLDGIVNQVRIRCAVGQNDLNRLLEDFFKDILNLTRGLALKNLNSERSNAPGLDLGDASARVAFQVTSRSDKGKIEETLKKLTTKQLAAYNEIYIFIIGDRKVNYKLKQELISKTGFSSNNIMDVVDLCREIVSQDIATIQAIHRKVADEQACIRIELEPQLPTGFKTKAKDFIEQMPDIKMTDASLLAADKNLEGLFDDVEEIRKYLDNFINKLKLIPRITRELLGWMYDHATWKNVTGGDYHRISVDLVIRKTNRFPGFEGDIRILREFGFIYYDEPDEPGSSAQFSFGFPGASRTDLAEALRIFTKKHNISLETMYSTMNFTPFGPSPIAITTGKLPANPKISNKAPKTKG